MTVKCFSFSEVFVFLAAGSDVVGSTLSAVLFLLATLCSSFSPSLQIFFSCFISASCLVQAVSFSLPTRSILLQTTFVRLLNSTVWQFLVQLSVPFVVVPLQPTAHAMLPGPLINSLSLFSLLLLLLLFFFFFQ